MFNFELFTCEFDSGSSIYGIFISRVVSLVWSVGAVGPGSKDFQNADLQSARWVKKLFLKDKSNSRNLLLKTSAITSKVEDANTIPTKAPVTTS